MKPAAAARIVAMHAERIIEARDMDASAARSADTWHATQCRDLAAAAREDAVALAELLAAAGAPVAVPDPRQLSLLSLGAADA